MDVSPQTNNDQAALWNGAGGRTWVEAQELIDEILQPFEDLLVDAVSKAHVSRALDVGCGTGSTTVAVARLLGANGGATGIDISDPMIAAARARAARETTPPTFILGNAEFYPFEPEIFDMIISRFGVMFFDNSVQAFANLRRAARRSSQLRCLVWRSAEENPFMTTAERAASSILPDIPARRPDTPGQFAFADQRRVFSILDDSGWSAIDIQPLDITCKLPEKELVRYLTRMGPVGRILQDADERTRTQVIETIRPAFDRYVHGTEVRFTAACWTIGARRRN